MQKDYLYSKRFFWKELIWKFNFDIFEGDMSKVLKVNIHDHKGYKTVLVK